VRCGGSLRCSTWRLSEAKPNVFVGFRASTQPTNRGIFRFGEGIAELLNLGSTIISNFSYIQRNFYYPRYDFLRLLITVSRFKLRVIPDLRVWVLT